MDIQEKIDALETELALAKNILFSKKGAVDIKKCEDLLYDIKRSLPSAIQEASYLLSQKDKIVKNAEEQANQILFDAKKQSEHLIDESVIVKKSEKLSVDNLEKTEAYCETLYNNTKQNIDKLLKNIEDYLMENLHIVRNNREELAGMLLPKNDKKSQ